MNFDGRGFLKDAYEPTIDWKAKNIYPEDMEKVKAAIADAIKEKKIFQLEHRVLRVMVHLAGHFQEPFLYLMIRVILWNGLAVKYSPRGSMINVACSTADGAVTVIVKDQGMGIKPEDIAKIFERYYRVEGGHMNSISGFGIGLYLCAEIVHRHDGEIWSESEFGNGSVFSFSLPLS